MCFILLKARISASFFVLAGRQNPMCGRYPISIAETENGLPMKLVRHCYCRGGDPRGRTWDFSLVLTPIWEPSPAAVLHMARNVFYLVRTIPQNAALCFSWPFYLTAQRSEEVSP